jgi:hypothetical protein
VSGGGTKLWEPAIPWRKPLPTPSDAWRIRKVAKRKYKAEDGGEDPKKRMRCPITRRHFLEAAPLLIVMIDEVAHTALPLENSTGSFGWNVNGKMAIRVGGIVVPVQINCNFTVIGSKEVLE